LEHLVAVDKRKRDRTRVSKALQKQISQPSTRTRILNAAAACIENRGALDTTMEDIAHAAGLGRKTIYRIFSNRSVLMDSIAIERINRLRDSTKKLVDQCASLEEAIVRGMIESLRQHREDSIFMAAIEASSDRGVEHYLVDPDSPLLENMSYVWKEAFARARTTGELRKDISDKELSSWLLGVHLILLLREDMDAREQRALLTRLVIPALKR
jgi:AcrR family transcriptional regulator